MQGTLFVFNCKKGRGWKKITKQADITSWKDGGYTVSVPNKLCHKYPQEGTTIKVTSEKGGVPTTITGIAMFFKTDERRLWYKIV